MRVVELVNHSKPKPTGPVMPTCPVCGKATYSRGGIHPQCASERQDKVIMAARRASEDQTDGGAALVQPRKQWTKPCPRCKRVVPARRAACECGFSFLKKAE
jgi:hypothetical protein